jgi:hypothetical protein
VLLFRLKVSLCEIVSSLPSLNGVFLKFACIRYPPYCAFYWPVIVTKITHIAVFVQGGSDNVISVAEGDIIAVTRPSAVSGFVFVRDLHGNEGLIPEILIGPAETIPVAADVPEDAVAVDMATTATSRPSIGHPVRIPTPTKRSSHASSIISGVSRRFSREGIHVVAIHASPVCSRIYRVGPWFFYMTRLFFLVVVLFLITCAILFYLRFLDLISCMCNKASNSN